MSQQTLIFLRKGLLTEGLLYESPILIERIILFSYLCGCSLLCLVVRKELLKGVYIEASRLPVYERSLLEHGVDAHPHDVLHLLVGYGQAKLLSLVLHQFGLHIGVPDHVFHLIHLLVVQVAGTLLHLDHFLILFHECLEFLHIDFLA